MNGKHRGIGSTDVLAGNAERTPAGGLPSTLAESAVDRGATFYFTLAEMAS